MQMIIDNIDFHELEAMKYWAPPASYSDQKKKDTLRNRVFSGQWLGAEKKDGAFFKFIKSDNGDMELLGRSKSVNGDYLNKINWVPQLHDFFESLPNGTCLLGELHFPNKPGSKNVTTIIGCLEQKARDRQEKGDKLHYYIFDVLAWSGEAIYKKSFIDRVAILESTVRSSARQSKYVTTGYYKSGEDLWNSIQDILAQGGEGMVIINENAAYEPGKRPSKTTMKVKKELRETLDVFFTGRATEPTMVYTGKEIENWKYWRNTRTGEKLPIQENPLPNETYEYMYNAGASVEPVTKPYYYGWAGSLEIGVIKEGKIKPVGYLSGLTEEMKANPKALRGKCIEVTCMEIDKDENGNFSGLRHAKMIGERPDLKIEDCTWERFMGN